MNDQTLAYWPTRIMLAIGVGTTAAAVVYALWPAEPCFGCTNPDVLGVPSDLLLTVAAVVLAVIGLVWMIRIFRGPEDQPPAWRYRR